MYVKFLGRGPYKVTAVDYQRGRATFRDENGVSTDVSVADLEPCPLTGRNSFLLWGGIAVAGVIGLLLFSWNK